MQRITATMDDWRALLPARLLHSSSPAAGVPLCVRHYRFEQDAIVELPAIAEHTVCFAVGRPAAFSLRERGRWTRKSYHPRQGRIVPAGAAVSYRVIGSAAVVHLYVSGPWFHSAVVSELGFQPERIRLRGPQRVHDPFLWMFTSGLLRRTRAGPPLGRALLDSAALGLACHLFREYTSPRDFAKPRATPRLPRDRARVSDFVDDLVAAEFGLRDLAEAMAVPFVDLTTCFVNADVRRLRDWLRHPRIRLVHALLVGSAATLDEIGRAAGITSRAALDVISYFAVGYPAAELRKLYNTQRAV